jgi:hypothetical protein
MTDIEDSRIDLKKGAACLLEFDGKLESGSGRLVWSIAPSQLRAIAGT